MQITKVIQKKNPLNLEQMKTLWDRMVEARQLLAGAKAELDAQNDAFKGLKKEQEEVINSCIADYQKGYVTENIECTVTYDGSVASYYDVKTGEKVEGAPLQDGEQLIMAGKRTDAEQIIRASSEED